MSTIKVNALGDTCPIPVVKAKNAIRELDGPGQVEVLVDNEIAVQNLTKMANQKGYGVSSQKMEEQRYCVVMTIGEMGGETKATAAQGAVTPEGSGMPAQETEQNGGTCAPDARRNIVVVISSDTMGNGDETLGRMLMKGFIFALTQQDLLPSTILFYNGGAKLTCEEALTLEDLRSLEAQGVEILTCGTCLNHYGLTEKLSVGGVTNMYAIVEKMMQAEQVVRP